MTASHRVTTPDGCDLHVDVGGSGPPVVLLHAGGPDRHSLDPIARGLSGRYTVVQPDIRGYGASVCRDPARHTWDQYVHDVLTVLAAVPAAGAHGDVPAVIGVGIGATIALRLAIAHPDRPAAVVAIGVEDIEDDEAKAAEIRLLDEFAGRVRSDGLAAGWEPLLRGLSPLANAMVREAIGRADPDSVAAAAAIGHDRSFRSVDELSAVRVPTLLFPGGDWRHPDHVVHAAARIMPAAVLAGRALDDSLTTPVDLAAAVLPEIETFLRALPRQRG
ncbi:alpha/beta hydrolase [Frankia sp. CcI49]|uniref:alpha/beta fold hydrolase n=1 Tax=unclassified Frankia TaxID=2632575 RepID=UPI0006CA4286|nr:MULTISPECIES: alpha/beta hydrolase [unclassified Frankia]KPM51557.1 alpha/beta hydrolase [Frankia sp. R43]ONH61871.1 alpha/beta hydrolase [Frankia sp. CcI49]